MIFHFYFAEINSTLHYILVVGSVIVVILICVVILQVRLSCKKRQELPLNVAPVAADQIALQIEAEYDEIEEIPTEPTNTNARHSYMSVKSSESSVPGAEAGCLTHDAKNEYIDPYHSESSLSAKNAELSENFGAHLSNTAITPENNCITVLNNIGINDKPYCEHLYEKGNKYEKLSQTVDHHEYEKGRECENIEVIKDDTE